MITMIAFQVGSFRILGVKRYKCIYLMTCKPKKVRRSQWNYKIKLYCVRGCFWMICTFHRPVFLLIKNMRAINLVINLTENIAYYCTLYSVTHMYSYNTRRLKDTIFNKPGMLRAKTKSWTRDNIHLLRSTEYLNSFKLQQNEIVLK